jgi:CheY-like chemotaxis protein
VDLNAVVKDAVEMARPKWKEECEASGKPIDIQLDLGDVPQTSGNVYELTQVVSNLIFNAVEAMPEGGLLSFRTSCDEDCVVLEVQDTGSGMDEETQEHLFEPFFTTKETGQGLGTSILYGIVTRHGGEIAVDSTVGEGTTFRVRLPRLAGAQGISASEDRARASARTARVLLVDDDDLVRETYEEALRMGGHEAVGQTSGAEALERCRNESFDVVITDLSMSGMSGLELASELKKLDPSQPVVLFSGWAINQQEERIRAAGVDHILVKPCLVEDLLDAVQRVLRVPVEV